MIYVCFVGTKGTDIKAIQEATIAYVTMFPHVALRWLHEVKPKPGQSAWYVSLDAEFDYLMGKPRSFYTASTDRPKVRLNEPEGKDYRNSSFDESGGQAPTAQGSGMCQTVRSKV